MLSIELHLPDMGVKYLINLVLHLVHISMVMGWSLSYCKYSIKLLCMQLPKSYKLYIYMCQSFLCRCLAVFCLFYYILR